MSLFPFLSGLAYVFAILYGKGWIVGQDIGAAVALVAAGLLCGLLAGVGPVVRGLSHPAPPQA